METSEREKAAALTKQGNFAEALVIYKGLLFGQDGSAETRHTDFRNAVDCLNRLGQPSEFDALAQQAVKQHAQDWRVLFAVADSLAKAKVESNGYLIGGTFHRGYHRGGGKFVSSLARDRVYALRLMRQAEPLMKQDDTAEEKNRGEFYLTLAELIGQARWSASWMLQDLTDLAELPDYENNRSLRGFSFQQNNIGRGNGMFSVPTQFGAVSSRTGAPVDEDGKPIFYPLPDSWETAKNDGERWRWALEQAAVVDPAQRSKVDLTWARFLATEFGVPWQIAPVTGQLKSDSDEEQTALPQWKLHELDDSETVAELATGARRITLPAEFNHIAILKEIIAREDEVLFAAVGELKSIRMARHQYPAAAGLLKRQAEIAKSADTRKGLMKQRQQIVGNWMSFESLRAQVADQPATFDIRYRNGDSVKFTAHPIDVQRLLTDVKTYLESSPQKLDNNKLQVERIGYRLVEQDESRYIGNVVASWTTELTPPENHFDAEKTITTPLSKAGAYLLKAELEDGNETRIVMWLNDTAINRKRIDAGTLYFIADAKSGAGIADADLEFFSFNVQRIDRTRNYRINTSKVAGRTDKDGLFVPDADRISGQRTLTIVRTKDGRFSYDGIDSIWRPRERQFRDMAATKVYTITDRPVYRPGHKVEYRMWVRQPRFQSGDAKYANQKFTLQLQNPKNETLLEKEVETDRWGGVDGTIELDDAATLGRYRLQLGRLVPTKRYRNVNGRREAYTEMRFRQFGQGTFAVEEYRKPEYEVIVDAPTDPVKLGDEVKATVKATYFFGAPVTDATVKYKVNRTPRESRWFPVGRWDWLYSTGYWWFAPDYEWYPGWNRWGCFAPRPFWRNWNPDPPETVLEGEAEIGPDGTYEIVINTADALKQHSDTDHNYAISVEVVDQSRRTILGKGNVIVARNPFQVFVWPNKGMYSSGDTVDLNFQARTPDGRPVEATGTIRLFALKYSDGKPVETEVESWDASTDAKGSGKQKMVLREAGQYRISVKLKDVEGNQREGGYVVYARGQNNDGRGYRFNDLELITDKREYSPGEKVQLQINTNHPGSTVLLFVRAVDGICPRPQVVRLQGKSTLVEVAVEKTDMPNFYIEALTISNGRLHTQVREVLVPPEQRITNVKVIPGQEKYRPGEEAKIKLKLTDLNGKPVTGNVVVSVYDASLEAVAASQIPEIRRFFWNFRRRHSSYAQTTLGFTTYPVVKALEETMTMLSVNGMGGGPTGGVFGGGVGGGVGGGGFGGAPAMATPRSAPMMMRGVAADSEMATAETKSSIGSDKASGQNVEPTVRSNFADTAFWKASAVADDNGIAEITFKVPDNLTKWKARVWAMCDGTRVGSGSSDIVSSKDLILRPQTPRFFTETDRVRLSAVVHNYLESEKQTTVTLESEGGQLLIQSDATQIVTIPANGEVRVDWNVDVIGSGEATVRMLALTDEESDATSLKVPCNVHGILKTESFTGVIRKGQDNAVVNITVPAKRIEEQSRLEVRFSPSLAGAMVDALPYLIEYPYGCTEQTLNRFLPAVLTQKTLQDMGVDLSAVQQKRTNLNSQEIGDAKVRAQQWKRRENPVFDEATLNRIVTKGVDDLTNMQLSDGGWGWFSGYGEYPSAHLTSQVVHGLTVASNNGVPVLPDTINKGIGWLKQYQAKEIARLKEGEWRKAHPDDLADRKQPWKNHADNLDAFVAFVLCEHEQSSPSMHEYLYKDRGQLSVYGKALAGLVFDFQQDIARRDMILRNIEQFLETDEENETAWLRTQQNSWWYWYGSENEGMARYLQLLLRVRPEGTTAPKLVKYLLNNRKHGTYWNSTRDTALVVEALAEYIVTTGEDKPDMTVEVMVDGQLQKKVRITSENLFSFDNVMVLSGDTVRTGAHKIEIRRTGTGPIYFNAYLTNFTKEDRIKATGLEVKVRRRFFRLTPVEKSGVVRGDRGQAVDQIAVEYQRSPLPDLSSVNSGDLIEVELLIDSKNDYEYLLLEDRKPSGFETDDQRSGYFNTGVRTYRELRDDRVSFFINRLARGNHSLTYRIRAEAPGQKISALPAKIEGMYAPELVGNSDEFKVRVEERQHEPGE